MWFVRRTLRSSHNLPPPAVLPHPDNRVPRSTFELGYWVSLKKYEHRRALCPHVRHHVDEDTCVGVQHMSVAHPVRDTPTACKEIHGLRVVLASCAAQRASS